MRVEGVQVTFMENRAKTILVVDDESIVRDLISGFLGKLGHSVLVAGDAETAIATFRSQDSPPDVLVTDIVMPKVDGPTLARALRQECPALGVLFVSSYPNTRLSEDELALPQNEYLAKPFSLRNFAAAIARLLKSGEASTERAS